MIHELCTAHGQLPNCPFAPGINIIQLVIENLQAELFGGLCPWSKLSEKALKLVFLTNANMTNMEYKRLYISFRLWDLGMVPNLFEIPSSF